MSTNWFWSYTTDQEEQLDSKQVAETFYEPDEFFFSQEEAESWLRDVWFDLVVMNVAEVALNQTNEDGTQEQLYTMALNE
jgi:hypothetical protein